VKEEGEGESRVFCYMGLGELLMGLKMVKFVSCRRNIGFPLLKSISREFAARVKIW
jgi:hypothetical protein